MIPTVGKLVISAVSAGGLLIGVPAIAAADETDLSSAEARCLRGVDIRLDRLDRAADRVADANHVADDHEMTLTDQLAAATESLQALRDEIDGATIREQLRESCNSVVWDHRVYVLVLPRTRLVVAADAEVVAADRLASLADRLEGAIDEAEADGNDVGEQRDDLTTMRDYIETARTAAAGVPGEILDLSAADWNDNHTLLDPARRDTRTARLDLRSTARLAREIAGDLRRW